MQITFTQSRELIDLARTVKPGDVLTSDDAPEELLQGYVANGIAREYTAPVATTTKSIIPDKGD